MHYIQVLCQSRLGRADHAYLTDLMLQPLRTNRTENTVSSNNRVCVYRSVALNRVLLLLRACSFPRELIYRAVA
jgi:hypothetical protein